MRARSMQGVWKRARARTSGMGMGLQPQPAQELATPTTMASSVSSPPDDMMPAGELRLQLPLAIAVFAYSISMRMMLAPAGCLLWSILHSTVAGKVQRMTQMNRHHQLFRRFSNIWWLTWLACDRLRPLRCHGPNAQTRQESKYSAYVSFKFFLQSQVAEMRQKEVCTVWRGPRAACRP